MPPPPPPLSLLIILTATILTAAYSQPATTYANCDRTFSCGAIRNVTFPFTGRDRPSYCGLPDFALTCRDNTITELTHDSLAYRVLQLDHTHKTLILSRSDLYNNTCPSEFRNTTLNPTLFSYSGPQNEDLNLFYGCNTSTMPQRPSTHFTCNSGGFNDPDWYHLIGPVPSDPVLRLIHCSMSISVPVSRAAANSLSNFLISVEQALMQGFNVSYSVPNERLCSECNRLGGQCGFDHAVLSQFVCICGDRPCPFTLTLAPEASPAPDASLEGRSSISAPVGTIAGVTVGLVIVCIITLNMTILCCLKRRPSLGRPNKGKNQDIEKFLLQNGLAPKRYKYSEIKKLTKSFNDKLGEGGYGSVYKGILPDGSLIAVKVLKEVDSDGEEFVNEVASISKTSHASLVGFCYEGNKRALVYEYMPNKSLDKFLSDDVSTANRDRCLNLEKLFNIAVGIARGLEYLHIGCSTRIVHFDIKPQNILLDEDFCPKISDFGLAKLCKIKQSVLSMLGTRGTIGYIAPEIFSRNFGGVSHKSDVYSYGMMVLEMAGAKQIVEADTIQSSENYFPDKIYEHVILGVTRKLDGLMIEEEDEIAKRMFLVGFWCIQTTPSNRPSMSKVVEMLEGSLESIQIPPKPVLFTLAQSERNISSSLSAYTETENSAEG